MKQTIPKIVLTGPESAGKTAMTTTLAAALQEPWSPEFARYFVAHLGRPYEYKDLAVIGSGQKLWENWYASHARDFALCDTDWTVLHIWETYRFQTDRAWREGYGPAPSADLYLLCAPDFPWQADALREHPGEREALFDLYFNLLRGIQARFVVLRGDPETRLETALAEIREL